MDLAIAIHAGIDTNGTLYVQAAAGIVVDSIPENGCEQTKNKARALVLAAPMVENLLDAWIDPIRMAISA
jgi:anthranilate synthase component 1